MDRRRAKWNDLSKTDWIDRSEADRSEADRSEADRNEENGKVAERCETNRSDRGETNRSEE